VASIPVPGGCSLHPVKNRGWGSFDKVADQNFPPYFYLANCTRNKTLPIFLLFLYFSICTFNKIFPLFFTFSLFFHWAKYTFNKTFSLEGEEAQNRGENLSQKLGEPEPKTGGHCARFRFQIWGDRSH